MRGQTERDQNIQRGETELEDNATERLVVSLRGGKDENKKTKWKGQDTGVKQRGAGEVEVNRRPGSSVCVLVFVCVKAHL